MSTKYIKIVGISAGILTSISMLPQLIKTVKEKKTESLSWVMIIILLGGIAGWIWYGVIRNDIPILVTNSFSFVLNATLLFFRFKYAGNNKRKH